MIKKVNEHLKLVISYYKWNLGRAINIDHDVNSLPTSLKKSHNYVSLIFKKQKMIKLRICPIYTDIYVKNG